MQQAQTCLNVNTRGVGLYEITAHVEAWLQPQSVVTGMLTLFIQHTSASLTVQENADPDVQYDLTDALDRLAPQDITLYRHSSEGPDDMPAHIKAALTDVSLNIPIVNGRLGLGTWQGIYVAEHRKSGHTRNIICHLIGE
ncbi:secondary thiamine-phosphate synthase enzyme YjbQ [Kordiimonas sp. SCSIO 12610]|uniref:secondary thiamine-phosphate synthase enzyme YjbQ n=1 Tax=Kordiimonas sp. SCSIO 12610 TaxID=2829597 RepID=UPI00210EB9C4|nr:secondary thiamine-phosphate synthase enzyme YjbQ [Kordiimonas sp. SCSIO 12610]UTW55579.1 secondary thiamine-phosphate synthase enzyme YjbQ [Kordiimonas sp. SCSIO 12610]